MAKNKPNDQVQVIDSSGRQFRSRRVWAEKKCVLGPDGLYRFPPHSQANAGAGSVSGFAKRRDQVLSLPPVQEQPAEVFNTGGDCNFLPYPQAERGAGRRSLRSMYPVLAKMGAGL